MKVCPIMFNNSNGFDYTLEVQFFFIETQAL